MRDSGIAWFQFSTPERLNGMTEEIKRNLVKAITQAQMDNTVRVLVFTGSGRAFCAGDDLKGFTGTRISRRTAGSRFRSRTGQPRAVDVT